MAARIQAGERAKGKKQFGFCVARAADEVLTCDALEMAGSRRRRADHREDQAISVNNPQAIRLAKGGAWLFHLTPRCSRYREWDSLNVLGRSDAHSCAMAVSLRRQPAQGRQSEISSIQPCCPVVRQAEWVPWEDGAWQFPDSRLIPVKP